LFRQGISLLGLLFLKKYFQVDQEAYVLDRHCCLCDALRAVFLPLELAAESALMEHRSAR